MKRSRQSLSDHHLRRENRKSGVNFLEFRHVIEHGLDHFVHHIGIHLGAAHQRCPDAECGNSFGIRCVQSPRDLHIGVERVLRHKLVDSCVFDVDDSGVAQVGCLFDRGIGVTHGIDHGLHPIVAKSEGLLRSRQFIGQRETVLVPTFRRHYQFHCRPLTGARVADVDPFSLEVTQNGDAGVPPRHQRKRLTVHGEHGTKIFIGACVSEPGSSRVGKVMPVGLRYAKVQIPSADALQVRDRPGRGRRRTGQTVAVGISID